MRRTTEFGRGNKYDFTTGCKRAPPPNRYNIQSRFKINAEKNRGKSFGLGRKQVICGSWRQ